MNLENYVARIQSEDSAAMARPVLRSGIDYANTLLMAIYGLRKMKKTIAINYFHLIIY